MYEDIMTIILQSTSDIVQGKRRRGFSQRHHRNNSQRALHRTTSQQLLPVSVYIHLTPYQPLCLCVCV